MPVYDDEKTSEDQLRELTGINKADEKAMEARAHDARASGESSKSNPADSSDGETASGSESGGTAEPKQSRAESKEKGGLRDQLGKGFTDKNTPKGLRQRYKNAKTARNTLAALGITSALVGFVVMIIVTLLPFKLTHVLETIEQRVGEVPQYAVEQRLEFYVSRYLMIRSLEATGQFDFSPGGADRGRFTYLGNSFWETMYTNWRGANLEAKLAANHNIKLVPSRDPGVFRTGIKLRATDFHLQDLDDDSESIQPLSRREARRVIKDFARDETRSPQVFKRWNMRRVMYKYYGVGKWKPFERTRDRAGSVYREKKLAFKRRLVNETVGRLSERYDKYLVCLLEADGRECRDLLKKADTDLYDPNGSDADEDNSERDGNDSSDRESSGVADAEEGLEELADTNDRDSNSRLTRRITSKIREFGLKKIISSLAAGVGIIETLVHIYETVDSGVVNQVIYDKNAQQYMAYGAPLLSAAHQVQAQGLPSVPGSNDFDVEDARVAHEILGDFDNSPVYQQGVQEWGLVSAQGAQRIWRDCNDDPDDGKETQLEAGETVCPNKKLLVDRTKFTESAGWEAAGDIIRPYQNTVGQIVGAITGVVDGLADLVGINDLIANLADKLGLTDLAMRAFSFLLNWFAGPVVTGTETDEDAFDALYAGVAVAQSAAGGDAGVSKEDTIGGAYLTDAQATTVKQAMLDDHYRRLEAKPFFARYFSPHIKESLTGRLAMAMPLTLTGFSQQVASVFTQPLSFVGSFAGVLTGSTKALSPDNNPFDALQMGYPADHPVLTANNGEGMDPDELETTYDCDLPPEERPQNSGDDALGRGPDNLPFDVPLQQDPCGLEEQTTEAGVNYFAGKLGAGDFEPLGGGEPTGGGGPVAPGGPCPAPEEHMGDNALTQADMTVVTVGGTSITVNPCIAPITQRILERAAVDSINLNGSSGYRDPQRQIELRRAHCGTSDYAIYEMPSGQCSPPTARPGHSNHEVGTAIDFQCNGGSFTSGGACWNWMVSHNGFGLINLPSESWHWSIDGS